MSIGDIIFIIGALKELSISLNRTVLWTGVLWVLISANTDSGKELPFNFCQESSEFFSRIKLKPATRSKSTVVVENVALLIGIQLKEFTHKFRLRNGSLTFLNSSEVG
ncbi:MAG: hypothetical protein ABW044_07090, partial [Cellvibrio sp.]